MKKKYAKPVVEKIVFDYKIQTTESECFESIINVRPIGGSSRDCVDGTPVPIGWTNPQTYIPEG